VSIDRLESVFAPEIRRPLALVRATPHAFSLAAGPGGIYLVSALIDSRTHSHLVLSTQRPDGTWSRPQTIINAHKLMFLPAVAANAAGQLAVSWDSISSTNPDHHIPTTEMAAISTSQAGSWRSAPLSQRFDLWHIRTALQQFLGDYQALTATPTGFEAVYITAAGNGTSNRTAVVSHRIG
jgi:hypothetical protein